MTSLEGFRITINGSDHNADEYEDCCCFGAPIDPLWTVGPERIHEVALDVWNAMNGEPSAAVVAQEAE